LAFTFGLGGLALFPLHAGAASYLIETPTPQALLDAIEQHDVSITFSAPTGYRAMLAEIEGRDLSALRCAVSAGEHLPKPLFDAFLKETGIRLMDGIGATEMLHTFIAARQDDIRAGATGKVIPGFQARIVDEAMNEVAIGEVGRLAVKGPTGCRYLADARQKTYVKDGWNLTGDAFRTDGQGYFWCVARADDMIISSGYNIAGPEVENALLAHPAVYECGVVGAPDPTRGQIVKAFVVLEDGHAAGDELAAALQDHVKATIAPYKYPRAIQFVDALPKTQTGKLQRFKLRQG
jgi:2-aminobenzoate-CoA ligase